ncbi:MAG: DUF11 domain-containing protein, partial [Acidobacteria bacterium]|nr:DUF11 domain-containing protein [Acidobacteriota bacterium]
DGAYPNVTSSVTGDLDGSPTVGNPASETLFLQSYPRLTKTFLTNPAGAGDVVTVEFTLTNTSSTSSATGISFMDDLDAFISGVVPTSLPAAGFCGAGSIATSAVISTDRFLIISNASLAASGSCTFSVDLQIPNGVAAGSYPNTTTAPTATVGGVAVTGKPATDTLVLSGAPRLQKAFTDDPVLPGDTVTLEFTLSLDDTAVSDATGITFTDDLDAALSGLVATGLPMSNVCGAGSQISGVSTLTLTGGTLAPGASCTFSVTLQVPMSALPGSYLNTTSSVVATVGGASTTGTAAQDNLSIAGLMLTKEFTDDPVIPGATANLRFTIVNSSPVSDATSIFFTDNLSAALSGLTATTLPMNPCGAGSAISGTTTLIFTGGNLTANTMCTFDVTVMVPVAALDGSYLNTTSNMTAMVEGSSVSVGSASDSLVVSSEQIFFDKTFTDDPVAPGGTVTLEFTLTNMDGTQPLTGITFTDDLDAALSGLTAIGLPINDVCGMGSVISGTSSLTLTGGNLPAAGSCTFSVTLQVPMGVALGTTAINTTSPVTGSLGGLSVNGTPASDQLFVQFLEFSKSFNGPATAGGTAVLTFMIHNLSMTSSVSDLGFTDDLDAVLSGLVAAGLPMNDVCGAGSQISGTSFLTFTGGSLLPGGSCSIPVTVQVPAGAAPGSYPNTTSDLVVAGLTGAEPATANLGIEPPPTFAKVFAPDVIGIGVPSTLTFTIDNSASTLAALSLDFTDNLPAGVVVATPANASTTCTGGTLTATAGTGVVSYTGGSVAAGASCTVQADVAATGVGSFVNTTGDLTSSSGNSGTASDTLTAEPPPTFAKAFAPATVAVGQASTLTFTIDNS